MPIYSAIVNGVLAETIEASVTTLLVFAPMCWLMQRRATATGHPKQLETFA